MSPYPGEEPLSLVFAVMALVLAGIIACMILWRMIPAWRAMRRFRREEPSWRVLRYDAQLEREVEALHIARRAMQAREQEEAVASRLVLYDELLRRAVEHAVRLIEEPEGMDEAVERAGFEAAREALQRLAEA